MKYVYSVFDGSIDRFIFLSETSLGYRVRFQNSSNTTITWKRKTHSRYGGLPPLCYEERSFLDYSEAKLFAIKQLKEKAFHFFHENQDCEKKMMALIANKDLK